LEYALVVSAEPNTRHNASHFNRAKHKQMERRRIRLRFRKEGDLRWIGHLDLARAWERLLRRASLPLAISLGCHPRPRISFPSALPMGEAGTDEVLEAEFDGDDSLDEIRAAVGRLAPAGIVVKSVEELSPAAPATELSEIAYEFPLPADRQSDTAARVERLLGQATLPVERGTEPAVDLRELLLSAEIEAGVLRFRLRVPRGRNLRARDVLAVLGLEDLRTQGHHPVRTEVVLK